MKYFYIFKVTKFYLFSYTLRAVNSATVGTVALSLPRQSWIKYIFLIQKLDSGNLKNFECHKWFTQWDIFLQEGLNLCINEKKNEWINDKSYKNEKLVSEWMRKRIN